MEGETYNGGGTDYEEVEGVDIVMEEDADDADEVWIEYIEIMDTIQLD